MTPVESRNSTSPNRVRCFNEDALIENVSRENWNLVKIVCTQPFNKHVQYGIAFIKVHCSSRNNPITNEIQTVLLPENNFMKNNHVPKTLGKFKLREESPECSDVDEKSSSLFERWKKNKDPSKTVTVATAIREALSTTSSEPMVHHKKLSIKHSSLPIESDDEEGNRRSRKIRKTDKILYDDNDDPANKQLEKKLSLEKIKSDKDKHEISKSNRESTITVKKLKTDDKKQNSYSSSKESDFKLIGQYSKENKQNLPKQSNFKKFLNDKLSVSTSISQSMQIKSPIAENSDQKKFSVPPKVIYKFKPFKNLLNGVVFVISGIQNPDRSEIRRKALEMGAKYKPDWDSQCTHLICAFSNTPKYNQVKGHGKIINQNWIHDSYGKKIRLQWRKYALDANDANSPESEEEILDESMRSNLNLEADQDRESASSDIIEIKDKSIETFEIDDKSDYDSGEDTEEEIDRIQKKQQNQKHDDFDKSTDGELNIDDIADNFFKDKTFYLDKISLSSTEIIKLKNYIRMHKGQLNSDQKSANYLIGHKKIKFNADFKSFQTIKPIWVIECHDMESLLPINRYIID